MVDLEPKIKGSQGSETPTIKPSRYDPRGDSKPLFDTCMKLESRSSDEYLNDPTGLLELLEHKLLLLPTTYDIISSHLDDYDSPSGEISKMPRPLTRLRVQSEESVGMIQSSLDRLGSHSNQNTTNPGNKATDGTLSTSPINNDSLDSSLNGTPVAAITIDQNGSSLRSVDEISLQILRRLDSVMANQQDPSLAVANRSIKHITQIEYDYHDVPIKNSRDGHVNQTPVGEDTLGRSSINELIGDGKISFFLLAYIDVLIGWMVSTVVRSHVDPRTLLNWGVYFRVSGVRPLPSYWFFNKNKLLRHFGGTWIDYSHFFAQNNHLSYLDDPLENLITINFYNNNHEVLREFYDHYRRVLSNDAKYEIEKINAYTTLYDLMFATIRLTHKMHHKIISEEGELPLSLDLSGFINELDNDDTSLCVDTDSSICFGNKPLDVIMAEAINLLDFYNLTNSTRGKLSSYYNIQSKILKRVRSLLSKGKLEDAELGIYDHDLDIDQKVNLFHREQMSYSYIDLKRSYITAWAGFVHEVYGLMEENDFAPDILKDYVFDYDLDSVCRVLDTFKSSPAKTYSVNGRLVDLMRLYHVTVFAPTRSESLKRIVLPKRDPITYYDFREFLKFYVAINCCVGDARVFMNKTRNMIHTLDDPLDLSGEYSCGYGSAAYCFWNESNPLEVVKTCMGFEWLDVRKINNFISLFEMTEDRLDEFMEDLPKEYIIESIQM